MSVAQAAKEIATSKSAVVPGFVMSAEIRPPLPDEMLAAPLHLDRAIMRFERTAVIFVAMLVFGILGGWSYYGFSDAMRTIFRGSDLIESAVGKIILAESNGCATAKNELSSATGPGQFIDRTWLRLISSYRPELADRPEEEILEMRRDPGLAREMAARLADQNASILRKHGFSVTPGTLYLSHFAGSPSALAILSAPDLADAADVMAEADVTGRLTRNKIVNANPFLEQFTVADLRGWADRKMQKRYQYRKCDSADKPNSKEALGTPLKPAENVL
jgi:hypothetical protein